MGILSIRLSSHESCLSVLPPSSWCPGPAMFVLGHELTLRFPQNHPFAPGGQREKQKWHPPLSLSFSDAPNYSVAHQGSGVLWFWDMTEAQLRESRREVGKCPQPHQLWKPSSLAKIFTQTHRGRLGIYQVAGIYGKSQAKSQEQPPNGVRLLPLCSARREVWSGEGRRVDKPASRSPFSPHSRPSALCSGELT